MATDDRGCGNTGQLRQEIKLNYVTACAEHDVHTWSSVGDEGG